MMGHKYGLYITSEDDIEDVFGVNIEVNDGDLLKFIDAALESGNKVHLYCPDAPLEKDEEGKRVYITYDKTSSEVICLGSLAETVINAIREGHSIEIHRLEPDWEDDYR